VLHCHNTKSNNHGNLNEIAWLNTLMVNGGLSLVTGDAAVDGGLAVGVDDEEGKTNGRILGWVVQGGHTFAVPPHEVLEGKDLHKEVFQLASLGLQPLFCLS